MAESSTSSGGPATEGEGRDHVGLALGALGLAVAVGLGLNAVVGLVVRSLQSPEAAGGLDLGAPPAVALFAGTFLACFAAALVAWFVTGPIRNPFRQGMLAMVAFFASFVVSILTMPIDRAFGRPGLAVLAVIALGIALAIGRRLTQAPAR